MVLPPTRSIIVPWGGISRAYLIGVVLVSVAIVAALVWIAVQLNPIPPRRMTIASGPADGEYHRHAQRFKDILARNGITVVERMTEGSVENVSLLDTPGSGVDVALLQGGVAPSNTGLRMLVALFYEPLWIFLRRDDPLDQVNQLAGRTIATGSARSGTSAVSATILAVNGIDSGNATFKTQGFRDSLHALKARQVDAVFAVSAANAPALQAALLDPELRLMNLARAEAYQRRFPHVAAFTLPAGVLDFARDLPPQDVRLAGTRAMLVAKADLHPGLIDLLVDAAREAHSGQGFFESAGEFPSIAPVDVPVSMEAARYFREGPTFLHRFLPFWVATLIERLVVLIVPLAVVIVPLTHWLPTFVRWRMEDRIHRWYRELGRLETELRDSTAPVAEEQWFAELERIRQGAERIHVPAEYASKAYALRSHIAMVRAAIKARARDREEAIH